MTAAWSTRAQQTERPPDRPSVPTAARPSPFSAAGFAGIEAAQCLKGIPIDVMRGDRKARMFVDTLPPTREAGPEVRQHYRRLEAMETTGVTHEFGDEAEDPR